MGVARGFPFNPQTSQSLSLLVDDPFLTSRFRNPA
jgi:hypothetical protein